MTPVGRAVTRTFGSLRVRNYRLFLTGQAVSMSGTWMQTIAVGWLVLQLTGSGTAVGITLGLQFLPMLLFGMWGGVLADRFDKRRLLMVTQSILSLSAFSLWIFVATGTVSVGLIYSLTFIQGLATVVDNPTRQSFVLEMVGRDLVPNAVSLNSAVFNASRIVGPAIAAALIATVGLAPAFLMNALSFLAVVGALWAMDDKALVRAQLEKRGPRQVRDGLRYVWSSKELRYTVALVAVVAMFGLNYSVVLPLLARFTFERGAETYGILTALLAAGALGGALVSAFRARPTRRFLAGSAAVFGALTILCSMAPNLVTLQLLLVPTGAASISFIAAANATLQLASTASMRGRVMALHGLVFLGTTPLGAPLVGWVSQTWGPRVGLSLGGIVTLLAATWLCAAIGGRGLVARVRRTSPRVVVHPR